MLVANQSQPVVCKCMHMLALVETPHLLDVIMFYCVD